MKIIILILIILLLLILFAYPIAKLIGKAWHKSYFEEITNNMKFDKNKGEEK